MKLMIGFPLWEFNSLPQCHREELATMPSRGLHHWWSLYAARLKQEIKPRNSHTKEDICQKTLFQLSSIFWSRSRSNPSLTKLLLQKPRNSHLKSSGDNKSIVAPTCHRNYTEPHVFRKHLSALGMLPSIYLTRTNNTQSKNESVHISCDLADMWERVIKHVLDPFPNSQDWDHSG